MGLFGKIKSRAVHKQASKLLKGARKRRVGVTYYSKKGKIKRKYWL